MAGGSGERFWPMSRNLTPKHLLKLLSEKTLLEETARRIGESYADELYVLTNASQRDGVTQALPDLPGAHILCEPARRDTAPAAALATAIALARSPDATLALLPADAMIHDTAAFRKNLADAFHLAESQRTMVTLAIQPTYPSTGFGYLHLGEALSALPGGSQAARVTRFVEKPDETNARKYLSSGDYAWNAGMFIWKAGLFLEEARRLQPELAAFIEKFTQAPESERNAFIEEHFPKLPKISVDYAIMEQAAHVAAIRAEFDWDDVGTWTALPTHLGCDQNGNTTRGSTALHSSRGNIVISNGRTIALCGVDNLVVVETPDAVLVCHRDHVQDIKKLHVQLPDSVK